MSVSRETGHETIQRLPLLKVDHRPITPPAKPELWAHPRSSRSLIVVLIALATLGSGVLNLYSLIRPALFGRLALLYTVFPVEFINLSRFLTLIAGFALIICSLNICKRKRRAFYAAATLAALSALFHLTKAWTTRRHRCRCC